MRALLCALFLVLTSNGFSQAALPEVFYQCWKASLEEDDNSTGFSIKAFRPVGFKEFKPGFFRQEFCFKKNGTCTYLKMQANENHQIIHAKWTYRRRDGLIKIRDENGELIYKIKVWHLEKNKMKLTVKELW